MRYIPSVLDRSDVDERAYVAARGYERDLGQKLAIEEQNRRRAQTAKRAGLLITVVVILGVIGSALLAITGSGMEAAITGAIIAVVAVVALVLRPMLLKPKIYAASRIQLVRAYWRFTLLPAGEGGAFVMTPQASGSKRESVRIADLDLSALRDLPPVAATQESGGLDAERSILSTLGRLGQNLAPRTQDLDLALLPPAEPLAGSLKLALAASQPAADAALEGEPILPGLSDADIEQTAAGVGQLLAFTGRPSGTTTQTVTAVFDEVARYVETLPGTVSKSHDETTTTGPAVTPPATAESRARTPLDTEIERLFDPVLTALYGEVKVEVRALDAKTEEACLAIKQKAEQKKQETAHQRDETLRRIETEIALPQQELVVVQPQAKAAREQIERVQREFSASETAAQAAARAVTEGQVRLDSYTTQLATVQRRLQDTTSAPQQLSELVAKTQQQERIRDDLRVAAQNATTALSQLKARTQTVDFQSLSASVASQSVGPAPAIAANPARAEDLRRQIAALEKQVEATDNPQLEARMIRLQDELTRITPAKAAPKAETERAIGATLESGGSRIRVDRARSELDAAEQKASDAKLALAKAETELADLVQQRTEVERRVQAGNSLLQDTETLNQKLSLQRQELIRLTQDAASAQQKRDGLRAQVSALQEKGEHLNQEVNRINTILAAAATQQKSIQSTAEKQNQQIEKETQSALEEERARAARARSQIAGHADDLAGTKQRLEETAHRLASGVSETRERSSDLTRSLLALRSSAVQKACDSVQTSIAQQRSIFETAQHYAAQLRWRVNDLDLDVQTRTDVYIPVWLSRTHQGDAKWTIEVIGPTWSPRQIGPGQHIQIEIKHADAMKALNELLAQPGFLSDASPVLDAAAVKDSGDAVLRGIRQLSADGFVSAELLQHIQGAVQ